MFPIGYSVELVPEQCSLKITKTVRIDETKYENRIRVSGRAGVSFVAAEEEEDGEVPSLYDVQGQVEHKQKSRIYRGTPLRLAQELVSLAQRVVDLENARRARENGKKSGELMLSFAEYRKAEEHLRQLIEAICRYATRRDIIVGDLFEAESDD